MIPRTSSSSNCIMLVRPANRRCAVSLVALGFAETWLVVRMLKFNRTMMIKNAAEIPAYPNTPDYCTSCVTYVVDSGLLTMHQIRTPAVEQIVASSETPAGFTKKSKIGRT